MKTTRVLLTAAATLLALATVAFALLNLKLPVVEFFGYGTGGFCVLGLLGMLVSERPVRRPSIASRPAATPPAPRPVRSRPTARRLLTHAA